MMIIAYFLSRIGLQFNIAKQPNGGTVTIEFGYNKSLMRIEL